MAPRNGFTHSEETRQKMSAARLGKVYTAEHKAKIGAANKGKVRARSFTGVCACGKNFKSGASNAIFCSEKCRRASYGHGLLHAPAFANFPRYCAICSADKDLVGDHDHVTGAARGILCRNCNLAIGNMADSPDRLRAAAVYLENLG